MHPDAPPIGRRERNKQQKLERITAAATELFSAHGVDEVTTQQIADRADVGAGTLFLYARSKAELLLLVHNVKFADAIETGVAAASGLSDPIDALMAIVRPIVECNRVQIENGRTYLRELVFGDPEEPHRREGLALSLRVEAAFVDVLRRDGLSEADAAELARAISAVMFISITATIHRDLSDDGVVDVIRRQVAVMLARRA
ncbi:TetR/AcrR family transcriptional regulator [Agromyces salentinus]|uniref:TetR/AcrR family transcriptional regulator n=1 Tax=Agromyces salentinus TaxID=269421 RepID=UPI001FEA3010|nr:TetR/AcrR family transcriptional regulator [Agromyces salentinus]